MMRLLAAVNTVSAVCGALLLLFIMFSISYGALTRTFKLPSPIWIIQISEYGLVWVCFLATAWVLAENKHVRVDILYSRFNKQNQRVLLLIQNTVSTVLCGIFCYLGILSTWEHFRDKVMDVGSIDVPKAWIIGVIPFGFLLLTLQFVLRTVENLRKLKTEGASHERPTPDPETRVNPVKAGG